MEAKARPCQLTTRNNFAAWTGLEDFGPDWRFLSIVFYFGVGGHFIGNFGSQLQCSLGSGKFYILFDFKILS